MTVATLVSILNNIDLLPMHLKADAADRILLEYINDGGVTSTYERVTGKCLH